MKKAKNKMIAILTVIALCITGIYYPDYVKAEEKAAVQPVFARINDTSDTTARMLAEQLVGGSLKNKIGSARLIGDSNAFGTFDNAYDIVGFPSGLVLSTGNLNDLTDFNDLEAKDIFSEGYRYFMEGNTDAVTDNLKISEKDAKKYGFYEDGDYKDDTQGRSHAYYEPAILEFTITPDTDTLSFQYMVASEEYPEYIGDYWDKFVLCVNDVNYAVLPGSGETVTIGNVSPLNNSEYYRGLTIKDGYNYDDAMRANYTPVILDDVLDNTNAISKTNFIFDGGTKVFSVNAPVNANKENTIRLAIADYNDNFFDSAVFIKANSVKEKPALYGTVVIKSINKDTGLFYLERKGGYVGAIAVDVSYLDSNDQLLGTETVEFKDGEFLRAVSPKIDSNYNKISKLELSNPVGGVEIVEGQKTAFDNWLPMQALKILTTTVKGTVYGNDMVPVPNAAVIIKSSDNSVLETKTNENGEYVISNVNGGLHSIYAADENRGISKEGTLDITAEDIESKEKTQDIYLDKNIKINASPEGKGVIIGGLDSLSSSGEDVKVDIQPKQEDSNINKIIDGAEKKLNAEELYTLDINLYLDEIQKTDLNSPILVTLPIPKDKEKSGDYYLYHIHNNGSETQILYDIDNDPDTFTAQIDKLSQFVLLYSTDASDKVVTNEIKEYEKQVNNLEQESVKAAERQEEANGSSSPSPSPSPAPSGSPAPTTAPDNANQNTPAPTQAPSNNTNNNPSGSPAPTSSPEADKDAKEEQTKKEMEAITVPDTLNIYAGQTKSIKPDNLPKGARVTYKSSKKSIVSVKANGKLAIKKSGSATITTTVTYNNSTKVYKTKVTVKKPYIDFTAQKKTMKVGDTYQFKAKIYGSKGKVTWSVSNKAKASINKTTGKLKAKRAGKVTIYAKAGKVTKKFTLIIKA